MIEYPWRAVDPTSERLAGALGGLPVALLGDLDRSQAVVREPLADDRDMLACWWTDAIGRRHWYISMSFMRWEEKARHPLEWIAPAGRFVLRERGGVREWLAICGCGVFGPPEKIAWMGERCGPCHDRLQEGSMPVLGVGNAFGSATGPLRMLPSGAALGLSRLPVSHLDSRACRLHFFDSLAAHCARWETIVAEFGDAVVVGERVVLLANEQLWWLKPGTGQQRPVPGMPAEPVHALAVQGDRLWLAQAGHLAVYGATRGDEWQPLARFRHRHEPGVSIAAAPEGQLALIHHLQRLEVIDPFRGQVVLTHRLGTLGATVSPIWLPSGDLVARTDDPQFAGFLRWRGLAERTPRGWMSRLLGSDRPERVACPGYWGALDVDADGRLVSRVNGGYALHHNETLRPTQQFTTQAVANPYHSPLFHSDGDLYHFSRDGLVVWPWREMTR